ncbi:hypothetical protein CC1G_02651 [Coprinopsis cinerea okayama7|uniref:P-loop containing nucleoside triphosphate hydrolase protein n=1 Tax=Coprinopsis cinerea (strain Okayama-7 / 130 / ATCC MYA-4618 / FGSC 9003) TaxID=240176 RepID=A8PBI0_COPC7|nr:hypothetical protein CC1G_02651 [Coprinopsis cinerea okayama7\|eukprot:XP_001840188.1 hypothetical protein CC1G_02651 [Coprinopsis cinerea okayama7\
MPIARRRTTGSGSTGSAGPPPSPTTANTTTHTTANATVNVAANTAATVTTVLHDGDLAESDYAERARRLIELTNDLKALGANHLLDIPRVVFIGNQSAGKSSVVEAVTGTKVPRDAGTCTRCPMECTMTKHSGPWQCRIQLRLEYDNDGSERLAPTTIHFADLTDPADVEIFLKRAQAAILSPGDIDETVVRSFTTKTSAEIKTMQTTGALLAFSFNTVELHVRDPQGADLSFVDLPGIIQHHSTDTSMVSLVQRLVKRSIKGLNTLIVLTIPMTDDVENQEAFALAKAADPRGLRTIGVGTKPDMLSPGNTGMISNWQNILQGNAHQLQHGYFCVKLPDDAIRAANHTPLELQRQELHFFNTTEPWKDFSDRTRFGIRNFVRSTSRLLINLIESNLPILKREVDQLLSQDMAAYERLPETVDAEHPLPVIISRLSAFCKAFERTVLGDLNKEFTHVNKKHYNAFRDEIAKTAPKFSVSSNNRRQNNDGTITLEEVRAAIDNNLTWELPSYIPFEATKYFILRHVSQWKVPALACFSRVAENLNRQIDELLEDSGNFGRFAELKVLIKEIVSREEQACIQDTTVMLNKLYNIENSVPFFTQNTDAYGAERRAWYAEYAPDALMGKYYVRESDEHKVMADIYAYFQVASKRFIDLVPLSIETELHQALASRIGTKLFQVVAAMDSENLTAMLREDPGIMARRQQLSQRIARLTAIKHRLLEYERSAVMPHLEPELLD